MSKVYTLYLSTQTTSGPYAPLDATNKANVRWLINWDQIYGYIKDDSVEERIARVTFQMTSLSQASIYTYSGNSGILAIQGISSKFSNSLNGLTVGSIFPIDNPVGGNPNHILQGDTLQTRGVTTTMPEGYGQMNILMLDRTGALMANVLDYQIILQFEMV